jgi:hypothetical protein
LIFWPGCKPVTATFVLFVEIEVLGDAAIVGFGFGFAVRVGVALTVGVTVGR